jgi:hypothetical protein
MTRMNRLAAVALCLTLAACSASDVAAPPAAAPGELYARDPARGGARAGFWRRADSDRGGVPIAWDFRDDVDAARRATLPQLVIVSVVDYVRIGPDQRPEPALIDVYDAIERDLVALMAGKADLVAVLAYYRQYDWYFYASGDADAAAIRALFAKAGIQDVTVSVEPDPNGEFYAKLRERVGVQ